MSCKELDEAIHGWMRKLGKGDHIPSKPPTSYPGYIGDYLPRMLLGIWALSRRGDLTACILLQSEDRPPSPIILDLNGDGVKADGNVFFDHAGDGFAEVSAWAGKDDGILVYDRNEDGVINDGTELFGDNSLLANGRKAENGFQALAEFDSNNDGKVDKLDENWDKLQILHYQEAEGEEEGGYVLSSLEDLGVASISTGYTNSKYVDEYGNEHRQVGSYTTTGGNVRTATDVWLQVNTQASLMNREIVLAEGIEVLPEIIGSGVMYNLRQAMSLDERGRTCTAVLRHCP